MASAKRVWHHPKCCDEWCWISMASCYHRWHWLVPAKCPWTADSMSPTAWSYRFVNNYKLYKLQTDIRYVDQSLFTTCWAKPALALNFFGSGIGRQWQLKRGKHEQPAQFMSWICTHQKIRLRASSRKNNAVTVTVLQRTANLLTDYVNV